MRRIGTLLLASGLGAAGCGAAPGGGAPGLAGALLPAARPRPAFTLTAMEGPRVAFDQATRGRLTFLFFGYTNCPDVCPATMANLAAVLGRLPSTERERMAVVFVTTDPERDSPERLREWLGGFDPGFIGLTGTVEEVVLAQREAGVAPAIRDSTNRERYTVSHAAQVIVVSPDDSVHVEYPFGTRQRDWADDLPALLTRWTGR